MSSLLWRRKGRQPKKLGLAGLRAIWMPDPISAFGHGGWSRRSVLLAPPASRTIRSRAPGRRLAGEYFAPLPGFVAVLIGVGATLGWQSHGDEAKEMVRTRAPWLGWLLPVSTTETPAAAATSSELVQHLEPMARNLAVVRRSVEELAAKQEQMAQNIATLREVEQDIRQKMSWPPYGAVSIPPHTPSQPAAHPSGPQSSSVPPPPAARPPLFSR